METESTAQTLTTFPGAKRETPQHLPASIVGSRPAAWDIYRFELVYFDPEFQRWQLFQEKHAAGKEKGHRRQIQALLNSLSLALRAVPHGTPFSVVSGHEQDTEITVTREQWERLPATNKPSLWTDFIACLHSNATKDGLLETNAQWEQRFIEMTNWASLLSLGNDVTLKLNSGEARDLISLLPILPHWDLYGAIRRAWAPPREEVPPTFSLWQDLGQLREPFYCSHFVYLKNGTDDNHLRSKQLFGYSVAIEALFADLSRPSSEPLRIALQDCFQYAHNPTEQERIHYSFYALLLDALQLALVPKQQITKAAGGPNDLFYFSYPIFSGLGRRHFLNLYVRPQNGTSSLETLWSDWRTLHAQLDWDQLRSVLVDELEQIDLARFQIRLNSGMDLYAKSTTDDMDPSKIESIVANESHLLFPTECACSGNLKWTYQEDHGATLGHQWRQLEVSKLKSLACSGKNSPTLPDCNSLGNAGTGAWRDDRRFIESPVQKEINKGRRDRLIKQQMEVAETIWKSKADLRHALATNTKQLWQARRDNLLRHKSELLDAFGRASGGFLERFQDSTVTAILSKAANHITTNAEEFFKPFFFFLPSDMPEDERWRRAYQDVASGTVHRVLSEYVETGVVHWLLHTICDSHCSKKDLIDAHEELWRRLSGLLDSLSALNNLVNVLHSSVHDLLALLEENIEYKFKDIHERYPNECRIIETARDSLRVSCTKAFLQDHFALLENVDEITATSGAQLNCDPLISISAEAVRKEIKRLRSQSSKSKTLFVASSNIDFGTPLTPKLHGPATSVRHYILLALPLKEDLWTAFWSAQSGEKAPSHIHRLDPFIGSLAHTYLIMIDSTTPIMTLFSLPLMDKLTVSPDQEPLLAVFNHSPDTLLQDLSEWWTRISTAEAYWQIVVMSFDGYKTKG